MLRAAVEDFHYRAALTLDWRSAPTSTDCPDSNSGPIVSTLPPGNAVGRLCSDYWKTHESSTAYIERLMLRGA